MLDPLVAINSDPPEVWLKTFHGFSPESWGFLGYTKAASRDKFVSESKPGALVVVGATAKAPKANERLRVLGMQQQTHIVGSKWDFLAPERHGEERADADRANRWHFALKAVRAWRVPEEERPFIRDIFPRTHADGKNGTAIGAYGLRLEADEARRILDLNLFEVQIFGGSPVDALLPAPARHALSPSRPGPVSQSGYMVREAEGPKHLYILRLHGSSDHFLGRAVGDRLIVKVGFSCSPATRRDAHNQTLPACAFEWRISHSTAEDGGNPFPSSGHALAGEAAMKSQLATKGESLGGEFFLADCQCIDRAWQAAVAAAENWKQ